MSVEVTHLVMPMPSAATLKEAIYVTVVMVMKEMELLVKVKNH